MVRLSEQLADVFARIELVARGIEGERSLATQALERGRPGEARERALGILEETPRSRIGLALWADAAEAGWLDHEVVEALERLSHELPFRADVWLRMAYALERSGREPDVALGRASELAEPRDAVDAARLWLADRDRARGDPSRAERWLELVSLGARASEAWRWRRFELALDSGDRELADRLAAELPVPPLFDGRAWLARARWLGLRADPAAGQAWTRALVLEAEGAVSALADLVSRGLEPGLRGKLFALSTDLGVSELPHVASAFALAEGRGERALEALSGAAEAGESAWVERYLELSIELESAPHFARAAELSRRRGFALSESRAALAGALAEADDVERLALLDRAGDSPFADRLRREVFARWLPRDGAPDLRATLNELGRLALALSEPRALEEIAAIERDLGRPLRVAIVGEFNAGKSSFMNALLGEEVAPVGVLPTTATLNHLVWAPDRFCRIELRGGQPDRVVPSAELKSRLAGIVRETVERVYIHAPLEPLRKIEWLDTPGFNAPDAEHARTARGAFRAAHVALWLLDATQPLKESERAVLEEIREAGLPLLVLLNKRDRLGEGEAGERALEAALAHVEQGLHAARLELEAPILAFSARLALLGKNGDADALRRSGFDAVEALLQSKLVDQSARLAARVARRRCLEAAVPLEARAERLVALHAERERVRLELAERVEQRAARLAADRASVLRGLESRLPVAVAGFLAETLPVSGMLSDRAARGFVQARARTSLGPSVTRAALAELGADGELEARLEPLLLPRAAALLAASAVGLVEASRGGQPGSSALSELSLLLAGELDGACRDLALALVAEPPPAVTRRARILCGSLRNSG